MALFTADITGVFALRTGIMHLTDSQQDNRRIEEVRSFSALQAVSARPLRIFMASGSWSISPLRLTNDCRQR